MRHIQTKKLKGKINMICLGGCWKVVIENSNGDYLDLHCETGEDCQKLIKTIYDLCTAIL